MRLLFLTFFLALSLVGQATLAQSIVTPSSVHIASLSHDKQWVVYADASHVYLARTSDLGVVDQWPYSLASQGRVTQLSFSEGNSNVFRVQYSRWNGDFAPMDINVYPADSVFFYNHAQKKKVAALPGNMMVAYATENNRYAVAANEFFRYPFEGKDHYAARKGIIGLFPGNTRHPLPKVALQVAMSRDGALLVLAYFDSLARGGSSLYSMEVRRFHDFSLVAQRGGLTEKPGRLTFSKNGKHVVWQPESDANDRPVSIWNSNTLTDAKLSAGDTVEVHPIVRDNNLVEYLDRGLKITRRNLITNEVEWTLWPGITGVFHKGVLPLDDRYVLVYGDEKTNNGLLSGRGILKKIDLEEFSIYSKNEPSKRTDTLFHPQSLRIQENVLLTEKFLASADGRVLVGTFENVLEVWSADSRRKLATHRFNDDIKAYPDQTGQSILVFEKYVQRSYGEFKVHVLDLSQGVLTSQIVQTEERDFMDPTLFCNCFAIAQEPGTWVCNDQGTSFWRLTSTSLMPERLVVVEVEEKKKYAYRVDHVIMTLQPYVLQFRLSRRLWDSHDYQPVSRHQLDIRTREVKLIGKSESTGPYWQLTADVAIYQEANALILVASDRKQELIPHVNALSRLDVQPWGQQAAIFYRLKSAADSVNVTIVQVPDGRIVHQAMLPDMDSYSFVNNRIHFRFRENLYSWIPDSHSIVHWDKAEFNQESYKRLTHEGDLQFDGHEQLLLKGSVLVNLADLQTRVILPTYVFGALLNGKYRGSIVYAVDSTYRQMDGTYGAGLKYPFYHLVVATVNQPNRPVARSAMIRLGESERIQHPFWVSKTGRYVAFQLENHRSKGVSYQFNLLDVETMKVTTLAHEEVRTVLFSPDDRSIAWAAPNIFLQMGSITYKMFDLTSGRKKAVSSGVIADLLDGQVLKAVWGGVSVGTVSGDSVQQIRFLHSRENMTSATFAIDQKLVIGGSDQGNVFVWNFEKSSPIARIPCGFGEVKKLIVSKDKLYVLLANMRLAVVDLTTRQLSLTAQFQRQESEAHVSWFTPEGYYWVGRDQVRRYHFVRGLEAFALSSFEVRLNRPDIILSRTGFSTPELITGFHEAYQKRLARYPAFSKNEDWSTRLPSVTLEGKSSFPQVTRNVEFDISVMARSNGSRLRTIFIYVNGNPVNGQQGLATGAVNEFRTQVRLKLSTGTNTIRVVAEDEAGLESFPESHEVELQREYTPRIYFVGVGVSKYQDTTMNLRYADVDVRRMAEYFSWRFKDRVMIDMLLNEHVTADNLVALKKRLAQTNEDDYVIVAFSGHGVLNRKMDFYFATHDIDFGQPEKAGFSYAQMEALTDNLPARRKLMLIDACHGGEVDRDAPTVRAGESLATSVQVYQSRGAEAEVEARHTSSFRLMQGLFSDMKQSNGTFVISASSGDEFAFESPEWRGGVFTYSFLHTLDELYDETRGKPIFQVSTLRNRVYDMVIGLTQNRQRPTSRAENLDWNWRFPELN